MPHRQQLLPSGRSLRVGPAHLAESSNITVERTASSRDHDLSLVRCPHSGRPSCVPPWSNTRPKT